MSPTENAGSSSPLGATIVVGGVNFSLYSRAATRVELLLFDQPDDRVPTQVLHLDPIRNRTYHYWHTFVPGLRPGQLYGYRVDGPRRPERGIRFDADKVLLDPYGRGVSVPDGYSRDAASMPGDDTATSMKSVVIDPSAYDWEDDQSPNHPASQTIVYEMHVRGFTRHPSSKLDSSKRGTYAGLIEKIPYLQQLGITAIELLPVFQFDVQDAPKGKINYWGYAPISFFAPHTNYSSCQDPLGTVNEFHDMVKALHRAGIEVILDVVFNHTAEGNEDGPTLCFRGIDNPTYYMLEDRGQRYANYSGCGNTLNTNHPIVRRLIVDSLRYWVEEMHVDGFRFDLASILSRDGSGKPQPNPPVLWDIESDPVLAGTKLIAEAWDAAGLYQVGSFVGDAWREWNGRFRDDVRDFFRGQPGTVPRIADRIVGSPQIYGHKEREVEQSLNFVTCHDGFTLNDLVSYNEKQNQDNGEDNRDGDNNNRSWNCGAEGPTEDPTINKIRDRQVKNFLATTLLSLGVPMIRMGDEIRHTQRGNNNAYCQDNELSWFDWTNLQRHPELHRFVSLICARRSQRNPDHERQRCSVNQMLRDAKKTWHGIRLDQPDWSDSSHCIAFGGVLPKANMQFHFILSAYWEPLQFELPQLCGRHWRRWIDTALDSPEDITPWDEAPIVDGDSYHVADRSVVMLYAIKHEPANN
jgi:glycogen operon protein